MLTPPEGGRLRAPRALSEQRHMVSACQGSGTQLWCGTLTRGATEQTRVSAAAPRRIPAVLAPCSGSAGRYGSRLVGT